MKRGADVVVIGGGVNGCSIAYQLARKGCRNVVVVEKDQVGNDASGRCPGGFRHQWGTEMNVRLCAASIRMFLGLQEELGYSRDLEVRQCGYLFLAYSEEGMEQFKQNVRLQRSLGVPVEVLDPQQTKSLVPPLVADGLVGATYCPSDGRANPFLVTNAYAQAAQRLGVEINTSTTVTGLATREGRITGVVTDRGTIETSAVACVAGARSPEMGRMVGVELPIHPRRHHILVTERMASLGWPITVSLHHGVSCFPTVDGGLLMGMGGPQEIKAFNQKTIFEFPAKESRGWVQLTPPLGQAKLLRAWAGTYDMSPDAQPILGAVPGVEGFYLAAGFSGHGFMMAPIVGKTMAETILGESTSVDISPLDVGRFERGEPVIEPMVK